ncbi:PQQ-binding-like beta-propeller repeat protein, partial [bacterium]|nr:PQQ-binding-like beta-propeller repeat protein [bacterium]
MTHSVKEKFDNLHTFVFKTLILISLFSLLITTIDLQASVNKLWNYRPQAGFVDTSPAVGDLDDDGVKDLVFCTVAGRVLALNSLGLRMWYYDVKEPITTPPLVADLNNDKSLEVLTLTNNGKIICLNGANGKLIWKYQMLSQITWGGTSLAVSGLQDNGNKKIIAADNAGNLICLNGDGSVQWSKKVEDKFNTTPAIGRLTKKGQKNILIGSDRSPLICFSSKGKELWRVNGEKSSGSGPLICDLEGDQASEILVGTGREFIVFDNNGKKIWSYKMRGVIHDAISFGDLDDDGKMEVIVADLIGDVVALNNTGRVLWKANATQRVRRSAAIADIDGDFKPEVLIAGYSSTLFVYNADGSLKNQIPLKGAMNGSPTVVDFKSDGNINVVCGANSALTAFSWENQKQNSKPLILFAEYRCNSLRTGTAIKENKKETATNMDIEYGGVYVGD